MFQSVIATLSFTREELIFTSDTPTSRTLLIAVVHALQLVQLEHFVIIDGKTFTAREEQIWWFSFRTRKLSM